MSEMHDDPLDDLPVELRRTLRDLRQTYGKVAPPDAGPVVSAFMGVGLTNDKGELSATAASNANEPAATQVVGLPNWRTTPTRRRQRTISALGAFVGTTVGKVVLGTAVAAAAMSAGQATGLVDLPGFPGRDDVRTGVEEPLDRVVDRSRTEPEVVDDDPTGVGGGAGALDNENSSPLPRTDVGSSTPGELPDSTAPSDGGAVDPDRPGRTDPLRPGGSEPAGDDRDGTGDDVDEDERPDEPDERDEPDEPIAEIEPPGEEVDDRAEDATDEDGRDARESDDDRLGAPNLELPDEDEPMEGTE
jgi:hypothetical protein